MCVCVYVCVRVCVCFRHTMTSEVYYWTGVLYHDASPIPVYLPITLVIAVGLTTGGLDQFYKQMMDLHKQAELIPTEIKFHKRTLHYHGM